MNHLIQRANQLHVKLDRDNDNWEEYYPTIKQEIETIKNDLEQIPEPVCRIERAPRYHWFVDLFSLGIDNLIEYYNKTTRMKEFEQEKKDYLSNKVTLQKSLNEASKKLQRKADEYFKKEFKEEDSRKNPYIKKLVEKLETENNSYFLEIEKYKEEILNNSLMCELIKDDIKYNESGFDKDLKTRSLIQLKQTYRLGFESKNPTKIETNCVYNTEYEIATFLKSSFIGTIDFFQKNSYELFEFRINSNNLACCKIPSCSIFFNNSEQLVYGGYEDNIETIYNFMALRILYSSVIKDQGTPHIICEGIRFYPSQINKVLSVTQTEGGNASQFSHLYVSQNIYGFTPKEKSHLVIEPVECAKLYHSLIDEERALLHILILAPLIPDDKGVLKDALNHYSNLTIERAKIIKELIVLIKNFSACFSSHPVCKDLLQTFADNDDERVLPLKKTKKFELPSLKIKFNEWTLDKNIIGNSYYFRIETQKKLISPLWQNFCPELLEFKASGTVGTLTSDEGEAYKFLSKQFHIVHLMIDTNYISNGCLFSSLNRLLTPISIYESRETHLIREAMAKFVENNRNKFQQKISYQWGISVDSYLSRLRYKENNGSIPAYGNELSELEIEICANAFGISIEVFMNGCEYRIEEGLMTPALQFGPKTKEKLILFNKRSNSYYALFPKIKYHDSLKSAELKETIELLNSGWAGQESNQHILYRT